MKYRIHAKNSNVMIKGKLALGEKVNERELDYLAKNTVPGFYKISYDGRKQLTYEAECSLSLERYLKDTKLDETSFWKITAQMLDVEIAAKSRGLYPEHLLMEPEAVFMDEDTLKMYFAYQPIIGAKKMTDNLFALIQDIIYQELKKNGGKGPDYLIDFQSYLQQGDYRLEHVRQYIERAAAGTRPVNTSKQAAVPEESEDFEQYTVMLGSGGNVKKNMQLLRIRTKEVKVLPGDVIKIGRSTQSTYCITGNTSIGRNHAAIIRRGSECFLKDMGSVNGTSVNGRLLKENQACRLQSGDRITLADEDFIFEIK